MNKPSTQKQARREAPASAIASTAVADTQTSPATPKRPEPVLSDFQVTLLDLSRDMILYGGDQSAMDGFLTSLAAHQYWRRFRVRRDGGPTPADLQKEGRDNLQEWRTSLMRVLIDRPAFPESPEPTNPTAAFRIIFRDQLRQVLEDFLMGGSPEEIGILHEVMVTWQSTFQSGFENGNFANCPLANAIAAAMQENYRFVKVPIEMYSILDQQVFQFNQMREKLEAERKAS